MSPAMNRPSRIRTFRHRFRGASPASLRLTSASFQPGSRISALRVE